MFQVVLEIREQSNNVPSRFPFESTRDDSALVVDGRAKTMAIEHVERGNSVNQPVRIGNSFQFNPRPSTSVTYRVEEV